MRKLIFAINMTLDGCCDHTKMIVDEELIDYHTRLIRDADLFVYGRKTYEIMVPYWPEVAKSRSDSRAEIEFAEAFCATDKVVFSRSLGGVAEKNTRIVRANLRPTVRGRNRTVHLGSPLGSRQFGHIPRGVSPFGPRSPSRVDW